MDFLLSAFKKRIAEDLRTFECISSRYGLPLCVLLLSHSQNKDISKIVLSQIRCSDKFVKINNRYYIILFFTKELCQAEILAQKLIDLIAVSDTSDRVSIGMSCSDGLSRDILASAFENLLKAQEYTTSHYIYTRRH